MRTYQTYMCRRKALGITKEEMAKRVGTSVEVIENFEQGYWTHRYIIDRIKDVCYYGFKDMDEIDHYRARILELAMEIKIDDNPEHAMSEIGHMMVELGKLQRELLKW